MHDKLLRLLALAIIVSLYRKMAKSGGSDYIDILLLGKTGMGKSSAGNKLLGLNDDGSAGDSINLKVWCIENDVVMGEGSSNSSSMGQNSFSFDSSGIKRCQSVDALLLQARGKQSPELPNLSGRSQSDTALVSRKCALEDDAPYFKTGEGAKSITVCPKVISNETTRLRVCDTQGFAQSGTKTAVLLTNLELIRQVLFYRRAFNLRFQCVLYFLPCRGSPERADGVLTNEIHILHHYFSNSIWERTVFVVTIPRRYKAIEDYTTEYGDPVQDSKEALSESLRAVAQLYKEDLNFESIDIKLFPKNIDCHSLQEMVKKPKALQTLCVRETVCTKCSAMVSITVGYGKYDNAETAGAGCVPMLPHTNACHPYFKRKWRTLQVKERCANCNTLPGEKKGCLPVGKMYKQHKVKHQTEHPMDSLPILRT